MISTIYTISKYKPLIRFNPFKKHMNPNIYMLMEWRGYEFVSAIVIEADKRIKSYKKIVEDYLCQFKADVNYFYMYYVSYPKELLREKEVLIFKKKFVINDEECIIDE